MEENLQRSQLTVHAAVNALVQSEQPFSLFRRRIWRIIFRFGELTQIFGFVQEVQYAWNSHFAHFEGLSLQRFMHYLDVSMPLKSLRKKSTPIECHCTAGEISLLRSAEQTTEDPDLPTL